MKESGSLLTNKYRRRIFFASGITALVALVSMRFFIIPYFANQPVQDFSSIINAILDNLMVALVSGISVTALILWLTPPDLRKADVEVIESAELKNVLSEALKQTSEFWYAGHTARWTCSVTLRQLKSEAELEGVSKKIHITILDPTDLKACQRYAKLRNRLQIEKEPVSSLEAKHQLELYSTIVSAYVWRTEAPLLDIEIGLSDKVSIFRVDLSSNAAIVTTPGTRKPALKFSSGSTFYKLFREEVILNHLQSRLLPLNVIGVPFKQLDIDNTRRLLTSLIPNLDLDDREIEEIIRIAKKAENPYSS